MKKLFTNIEIKNFLPHRTPMLMVDHILTLNDSTVETRFEIKPSCIFLKNGYLRESGMIENMAQTCSSIVGKSYFDDEDVLGENNAVIGFISAIKSVTIHKLPEEGQVIKTYASLLSRFDGDGYSICTMSCSMKLEEVMYANCEMNLFIQEL